MNWPGTLRQAQRASEPTRQKWDSLKSLQGQQQKGSFIQSAVFSMVCSFCRFVCLHFCRFVAACVLANSPLVLCITTIILQDPGEGKNDFLLSVATQIPDKMYACEEIWCPSWQKHSWKLRDLRQYLPAYGDPCSFLYHNTLQLYLRLFDTYNKQVHNSLSDFWAELVDKLSCTKHSAGAGHRIVPTCCGSSSCTCGYRHGYQCWREWGRAGGIFTQLPSPHSA